MIDVLAGIVGSAVLLLGLSLATIGLFGMFRHPDIFEQLHAAGLVTGPGVILALLASLASGSAEIITSAALVVVFILVTSSLSTHVIALAAWRQRATTGMPGIGGVADAAGTDGRTSAMRVVLAHDGSPGSEVALALAASVSWPEGTMIRVVGVTEGDLPPLADTTVPRDEAADRDPDRPAIALAGAGRDLEVPGRSVEYVLRAGDPVTAIVDEAEVLRADLVVLGSRGQGALRAMLAGSVAAGVLDQAPCPVLVARGPRVEKILLATDGSEASAAATDVIARWPIFRGMDIQVLSVATQAPGYRQLPPTRAWREASAKARHRRSAVGAAARLNEAGRRAFPHVRLGGASSQIIAFAETQSVDLIVLGSRGRTGLTRTLLGSVASDVLASAHASVLVVRSLR